MEKYSSLSIFRAFILAGSSALILLIASASSYAQHNSHTTGPRLHSPYQSSPLSAQALPSLDAPSPDVEYHNYKPQPLMHGEGFNYDLYYNYRLTPHIILSPNLQQTTKPGAVEDNSQRFIGGLSAGIRF